MLPFSLTTAAIVAGILIAVILLIAILFRRVVSTNVVHIVQRGRATIPMAPGSTPGTSITPGQPGCPGSGSM